MRLSDVFEEEYALSLQNARTVGVDIGSRATKCILLYDGNIYGTIVDSGVSSQNTAFEVVQSLLDQTGKNLSDINYLVGTGYGRIAIEFPGVKTQVVTEITCHAMGAHYLNADTRTIIDIGGQDSKAIKIDPYSGKVIEFIMNDKCAAGTGRFLEKVAQMLELDLEELGDCTLRADKPASISSQCVVFAESEVISLKASGESRENIAAGIHYATARRVKGLIKRIGIEDTVLFTGGVSNNAGMKKVLEEVLEMKLGGTKFDLTLAGALGASVYAHNFAAQER